MAYDRSAYKWFSKDGINKRFKTPPDSTWTEGRNGFAKPKVVLHYNFDTEDCVPAMSRYGAKKCVIERLGRGEASKICEQFQGPRPQGMVCRHLCHNDSTAPNGFVCCNPRHIMWDTQLANVADVLAKGMHVSQTHKPTKESQSLGGRAVTSKIQVCERCGHTGKFPSFAHHIKKCL